jgi:hypothetical protein
LYTGDNIFGPFLSHLKNTLTIFMWVYFWGNLSFTVCQRNLFNRSRFPPWMWVFYILKNISIYILISILKTVNIFIASLKILFVSIDHFINSVHIGFLLHFNVTFLIFTMDFQYSLIEVCYCSWMFKMKSFISQIIISPHSYFPSPFFLEIYFKIF